MIFLFKQGYHNITTVYLEPVKISNVSILPECYYSIIFSKKFNC